MFFLKKLISEFLLPLSLVLECLFLAILLIFSRWQKLAKTLLVISFILLLTLSFRPVTDNLLAPLERQYQPLMLKTPDRSVIAKDFGRIKWIVVLGGGYVTDPRLPEISNLSPPSLSRLTEGIRIYNELPGRKLLLSGAGYPHEPSLAEVMAHVAVDLGVKRSDIVLDEQARDTEEEARVIHSLVKSDPFILITSAFHMPRSMDLFRHYGMNPVADPTDFLVKENRVPNILSYFPGPESLTNAAIASHEYLGMLWSRIRGKG